jgi:hypothetical protein
MPHVFEMSKLALIGFVFSVDRCFLAQKSGELALFGANVYTDAARGGPKGPNRLRLALLFRGTLVLARKRRKLGLFGADDDSAATSAAP